MKQLNPMPLPGLDSKGDPDGPCRPEFGPGCDPRHHPGHQPGHDPKQGDNFPACLAEALDILVDRATRHGLVEVAHLLEVAALAARDAAALSADRPCQPERARDDASSAPPVQAPVRT